MILTLKRNPLPSGRGKKTFDIVFIYRYTYNMKIKIQILICKRCGHKWTPRKIEVRICPKCKSAWWDRDK